MDVDSAQAAEPGSLPLLLHVENDPDLRTVLKASLAGRAEVVTASNLKAAQRLLRDQAYSAVVIDPGLPDGDGLSLLDQIERMAMAPPVVILSVTEMPREIRQRVAAAFVKSRVSEFDLAETILSLIDDHAAQTASIHLEA
jgi:DNA-binding response OmpR family regulator